MHWRLFLFWVTALVVFGAEGEARYLSTVRQLVFAGTRSGEGYFTSDGNAIDFQSEEGAFSPDGKLVVFCSLRDAYERELSAEEKLLLEKDPAYFGDIWLMNADGSGQRRLTQSQGYDGGPFFSPDGQRIIWRRFETNGAVADVFTMKLDGSDVRRLTDFKSMSWAP